MKYSIQAGFRFKLFTVVASILCGSCLSVSAATYYADGVGGHDTAAGTSITTAWQSVSKVSGFTFAAGDIVAFKRGSTWSGSNLSLNGSGTSSHLIRATCYDASGVIGDTGSGALPKFTGTTVLSGGPLTTNITVVLVNQQYWTIEDLDVSGGLFAAVGVWLSNLTGPIVKSGITLRKLTIHDTGSYGPSPAWWATGIIVSNDGANQLKFDSLLIDQCTISNCNKRGISLESTLSGASTMDTSYYNTNVQITNNAISQTRIDGMYVSGSKDFLMSHNSVDSAGNYNPDPTHSLTFGGVFWTSCWGSTVQYNTISNTKQGLHGTILTDNFALDLDLGNSGVHTIQYNFSHNNYDGFFESLPGSLNDADFPGFTNKCIVQFNVSYHDDLNATASNLNYAMLIEPLADHNEFYRNTFYCGTGPAIVNVRVFGGSTGPTNPAIFKDNIFYCPVGFYNCLGLSGGDNNIVYDYNCFSGTSLNGLTHNTNATDADPLFLTSGDPTTPTDLMLKSNSPCLKRGTNTGIPNPVPQVDDFAYPYDLGLTPGADQYENVMFFGGEGNTSDVSGHGNTGTLGGSGTTFPGSGQQHSGNFCFSFTGAGWMTVPAASTNLITNELAVNVWVYPTTSAGYRRLANKMTSGGTDGFFLDLSPTNQIRWHVRGTEILTTTVVAENVWTHIEAVYTQSGPMAVYVNGSVVGSTTAPNLPAISNTALLFLVAADNDTGSRFVGKIDNVEIRHDSVVR